MAASGLEQIRLGAPNESPTIFAPLQNENPENEPHPRALFHAQAIRSKRHYKLLDTPVDELTNMPLPVLPPAEMPDPTDKNNYNWHHLYHPSYDPRLASKDGLAVRHVRLQLLPIYSHHGKYHELFEGPTLPSTNAERFGQIVLAVAGYVPNKAIDLEKDDPTEPVEMPNNLRQRLQTSGELQSRGELNIATFIRNYLVKQDLSSVDERVIDEFIVTYDQERKRFLGHWLLAIASEVAAEPIEPIYSQALEEGLIIKPAKKLPNVVKSQINGRKSSDKAINALRGQLKIAHGI